MRVTVKNEQRKLFNDTNDRKMLLGNFNKLNNADLERKRMRNFGISTVGQLANDFRGVGLENSGYNNSG